MESKRTQQHSLDADFVLLAYASGYFPMADPKSGEVGWFSPDPRAIFELNEFHVPRSARHAAKKFDIHVDRRFEEVIRTCAKRPETWISEEIIRVYQVLHERGFAHSVETWKEEELLGGLYGVSLGGAFFGESMFSRARDASKVALLWLVERLKERKYELLDTQFLTQHLERFGAKEIPRTEYLRKLKVAVGKERIFFP